MGTEPYLVMKIYDMIAVSAYRNYCYVQKNDWGVCLRIGKRNILFQIGQTREVHLALLLLCICGEWLIRNDFGLNATVDKWWVWPKQYRKWYVTVRPFTWESHCRISGGDSPCLSRQKKSNHLSVQFRRGGLCHHDNDRKSSPVDIGLPVYRHQPGKYLQFQQ